MSASEARPPVWFAAAAVALLASLPLAYVLVRAAGAGADTWSGLLDRRIPTLLGNTLGLAAVVCAGTLAIGTALAYLIVRTDLPGRRALAVLAALPLAIPPYVGAVAYADVLGPRGGFRDLLGVAELPSIFGFPGSALTLTLFTYPYVFLLAAAALRNLNPSYEEAARGLGRGGLSVVLGTTVRLIAPALAGGTMLVGLYVLSDFGAVSLMRYDTFTTVIYEQLGGRFDPPGAAALSSVLVILTLAFLALGLRVGGRGRFEQTGAGFARPSVRELGRWRWPALAAVLLLLGLALLLPLARVAAWTAEALPEQDLSEYAGWAWNSALVSILAASVAAACALPVAVVMARARRGGGRLGVAVAWLAQAGYALPGVIVALALVAISTRFVDPLYGTLALLVAAFVIRFLPQAIQGEEAGLAQIGDSLLEAARGLGTSRAAAFRRVVLPLLRPSLAVAWAVVFLTAVKELPATLVLRPLGFDTLPVRVWTPARDGLYADAGPAALLLVIVSIVPLYLLLARRRGVVPALS
jgi:iron(III) transport system permease protein